MKKESAYALQELERLHHELIAKEQRGCSVRAKLRWALGWCMDMLVERSIDNYSRGVAYGDERPSVKREGDRT